MSKVLSTSTLKGIVSKVERFKLASDPEVEVLIRHIPIGMFRRYGEAAAKDGEEGDKARSQFIKASVVNEDGTPVFGPDDDPMEMLSIPVMKDIFDCIGKANNKAAKKPDGSFDAGPTIEEMAKN